MTAKQSNMTKTFLAWFAVISLAGTIIYGIGSQVKGNTDHFNQIDTRLDKFEVRSTQHEKEDQAVKESFKDCLNDIRGDLKELKFEYNYDKHFPQEVRDSVERIKSRYKK